LDFFLKDNKENSKISYSVPGEFTDPACGDKQQRVFPLRWIKFHATSCEILFFQISSRFPEYRGLNRELPARSIEGEDEVFRIKKYPTKRD